MLDQLKNDYSSRLNYLDKETKSGDIDFSDSELKEIRRKLINLGSLLNNDMEKWCDTENDQLTNNRVKRRKKRKRRNWIIGSITALIVLIIGGHQIEYNSSADARALYDATMASANSEFANANYDKALNLYQKAENEYDASYMSTTYKNDAHSKAIEASDKIVTDWENQVKPLLQSNKPAQAKALTLALPSNLVLEGAVGERYSTLSQQIDNDLATRTSTIIDELLNDLYSHQGKLSESGKQELNEMIQVVPDNYWLNFIKEKTK